MSFQALSHSPSHDRASALTSPPPPTFYSLPSIQSHPTQKKEHSLLVLPSVYTIINFATEFFEMFTKLQSEHPQTVFRVFRVFHFAFGPQNSPVLVQIRTKPANHRDRPAAILWLRKTPKKAIHPLACVAIHEPVLQAIAVVVFGRRRLYFRCPPQKRASIGVFK